MARYIDADKIDFSPLKDDFDRARAVTIVKFAPTADVVEVKHGEWLEHEEMFYDGEFHSEYPMKVYKCSSCGRVELDKEPYCHCGAKMDGGNAE